MSTRKSIYKAFQKLDSMPAKLVRGDAQKRGNQFEELILELFDAGKLLRKKSYHTSDGKSEQIDGAIKIGGIRALIEVKWVNSGLAASELYAFLGKVEGKFIGTVGVFISREELTPNFLKSLRSGRRQCVIVIHGDDVDLIFKPDFPLSEYLSVSVDSLSFDNIHHLPASEFFRKYLRENRKINGKTNKEGTHHLIKKALLEKDFTNVIEEWIDELEDDDIENFIQQCIEIYLRKTEKAAIGAISKENLKCLIAISISRLPNRRTEPDWFFYDEFSMNFRSSVLGELSDDFSQRLQFLNDTEITKIGRRLKKQWEQGIGDYYYENDMAELTETMWTYLNPDTKEYLLSLFLDFISSDRQSRFPQMRVAQRILSETSVEQTNPIVRKLLREKIRCWFIEETEGLDETEKKKWRKRMVNWYSRQYDAWRQHLNGTLETVVKKVIRELEKTSA